MRLYAWLLVGLLFILMPASRLSATETERMDGIWWQQLPADAKVYAVQGMIESYQTGYLQGTAATFLRVFKVSRAARSLSDGDYHKILKAAEASQPSFSKTFGTYVDGINDFYANYPSRIRISVGAVIGCQRDSADYSCDDVGK